MNDGTTGKPVRRRRSWYRRRLRMQRTLAAVVVGTVLAGVCWQNAAHYFSLPALHASRVLPDSFWTRGNIRKDLAFMAARSAKPAKFLARIPSAYPYSVVPGGVKDTDDLRYAALRDYVVRRHYARFNFTTLLCSNQRGGIFSSPLAKPMKPAHKAGVVLLWKVDGFPLRMPTNSEFSCGLLRQTERRHLVTEG